jgi:hypothetical protein
MIGHSVCKPQPAEPPVGQVHLHFLAKTALRQDRIAVTHTLHRSNPFVPANTSATNQPQIHPQKSLQKEHSQTNSASRLQSGPVFFSEKNKKNKSLIPLMKTRKKVVVDAVWCEPVSARIPCLTGKKQGISHG